jgi:hypothetical protein
VNQQTRRFQSSIFLIPPARFLRGRIKSNDGLASALGGLCFGSVKGARFETGYLLGAAGFSHRRQCSAVGGLRIWAACYCAVHL